jgi:predicted nucleotidyltransferase
MTNSEAEKWAMDEARRITLSILKEQQVKAWLFGSRATGRARNFSDIDIALDAGAKQVARALWVRLAHALEESHIPFRVDLVDMCAVSAAVRISIEQEGQQWID